MQASTTPASPSFSTSASAFAPVVTISSTAASAKAINAAAPLAAGHQTIAATVASAVAGPAASRSPGWIEPTRTTAAVASTEAPRRSKAEIVAAAAYGVVAEANQQDGKLSLL